MTLTAEDRLALHELVALHGHLMDAGEFDRLGELFTHDVVYDLRPLGYSELRGIEAIVAAARALGDDNPLGHHVTNIVVTATGEDSAEVRSKGLAVLAGGATGTVVYRDVVRRTPDGWRIATRAVIPRSRPLHA